MNSIKEINAMIENNKMLVQRVYDNQRRHIGYMIGHFNHKGGISIGISKCSKCDKFNRALGMHIAFERALYDKAVEIPYKFAIPYAKFYARCEAYYKINSEL